MQRHFSNRGEALAEVTAARMAARRKPSTPSQLPAKTGRTTKSGQWFFKPGETMRPLKK